MEPLIEALNRILASDSEHDFGVFTAGLLENHSSAREVFLYANQNSKEIHIVLRSLSLFTSD